jgi:hypothetical protein
MAWFRCLIEGENFPLTMDGRAVLLGFFTTRWVEADTVGEAELNVVGLIRTDPVFANMRKAHVTPMVYVRRIDALATTPDEAPGEGFTFFEMSAV